MTADMATQLQPSPRQGNLPLERPVRSFLSRVNWRWLVVSVLRIVAILIVSYLVAANVLLRTRLLRNAISGVSLRFGFGGTSTALRLDYKSAYSILPGRVHVEGLTIRGRDSKLEWFLTLDRADVSVSLFDLMHRSFHCTRVRSSGFAIQVRQRLHREDATPDVTAALPPIAGFVDPPLLDDGPPSPPLTDEHYNLWMIDLEDVEVDHVREIWIHAMRSEGDSRVRGRWLYRPQRWLDVGPATIETNGVDLSRGGRPLVTGLRGSIAATVYPFDLRQVKGGEIFDHISYGADLRGRAIFASVLHLLAPQSGVNFKRWEGPFDAHVVLDHGKLLDGTRVRTEAADCEIEAKGLAFAAPIRIEIGVEGDLATVDTHVSGLRVSRLHEEMARVASIAATVTSRRPKLAQVFDDARFTLDVGGAKTSDIAMWKHFLPPMSTFVIRSGMVTADGHADGSLVEKRGRAKLRIVARGFDIDHGYDRLTADVTSDVQLHEVSLPGGRIVGAATITAKDMEVALGGAILVTNLDAHVDLRRGTLADKTFDLSGSDVVLRAISVRAARSGQPILVVPSLTVVAPRLAIASSGVDGNVSIDLPRADLVSLGGLRELLPMPANLRIEGGRSRARVRADVDLGSGAMRGDGEVVVQGIRGRAGLTEFFGDLHCTVRARRTGGAEGTTDLSGSTIAITRAGTGNAAPAEDAWWGSIVLRNATLRTSEGVRFDAKAHLAAKDASPATVLVSQNTGIPTWAANVFRMPALDADAQVRVAPSSFEVLSVVARGGNTSVRAEYAKRDGRTDGAVLLDLGWIDLGYDLADGATGLVIVGPQSWYGRKTANMRDAAVVAKRKIDAAEQLARYAAMTPGLRKDEARTLAAQCTLDARACNSASFGNLLRAAADANERGTLSGITYAPMVVLAAKRGMDGTTLDPLVMGSLEEALRIGGESTLDNIPSAARFAAASDSDAARGKVIAVSGRASSIQREGLCSVGTMTTDAEPVYFVTPFAITAIPETFARFRGVFVQRYASTNQPPSLVLVGAFIR